MVKFSRQILRFFRFADILQYPLVQLYSYMDPSTGSCTGTRINIVITLFMPSFLKLKD